MSHMTLDDRVTIQEGLDSQQSCNAIAKKIGKNRSTVTREIEKHRVCNGCNNNTVCKYERYYYYASYAHNDYQDTLISSREGINQDPESLHLL